MKARVPRCVGQARSFLGCAFVVAGLLLVSGLAPIVQAGDMVPYRAEAWGYGEEFVQHAPAPEEGHPWIWYTGIMIEIGEATHFGCYTTRYEIIGDLVVGEDGVLAIEFVGTFVQTAADGSSVSGILTITEILVPGGPPFPSYGYAEIVSGTGRFEGATGSWQIFMEAHGDYDAVAVGSISSVGSLKH